MRFRNPLPVECAVIWGLAFLAASAGGSVGPGALDPTFSGDGWATVAFDHLPESGTNASKLVVSADGRIFVAGDFVGTGTVGSDFALACLLPTGEVDPNFDEDGRLTFGFDLCEGSYCDHDQAFAIDLAPDGRVAVAGTAEYDPDGYFVAVAARLRRGFEQEWSLDPTFAGDGRLVWNLGGGLSMSPTTVGVHVLDDGRIVAGGVRASWQDYFGVPWVSRLLPTSEDDGTALDPSFGSAGLFLFGDSSRWHDIEALDVDGQGRVVAAGVGEGDVGAMLVFRLLENGTLDPAFAGVGWRTVDLPDHRTEEGRAVALAPDGAIFVAGAERGVDDSDVLVVKLLPSGELDADFGEGGATIVPRSMMGQIARANAIRRQGDGKVVVAGDLEVDGSRFFALRLDRSGHLDPSFGDGGVARLSRGPNGGPAVHGAFDLALQPDGRVLLLGSCEESAPGLLSNIVFCVARLENDYIFGDGFEDGTAGAWTISP